MLLKLDLSFLPRIIPGICLFLVSSCNQQDNSKIALECQIETTIKVNNVEGKLASPPLISNALIIFLVDSRNAKVQSYPKGNPTALTNYTTVAFTPKTLEFKEKSAINGKVVINRETLSYDSSEADYGEFFSSQANGNGSCSLVPYPDSIGSEKAVF